MHFFFLLLLTATIPALDLVAGWNRKIKESDTTWDCYVPTGYLEAKDQRFPVLYASSPSGNPSAHGLEAWADLRGVLVVAINDSKNGPLEPIEHAQDLVWAAAERDLRLHPCLRYAMGQSGGGAASVRLILKHPDQFAGILVNVHSAGGLPKHIAAVYVGGLADTTHSCAAVRATAEGLKSSGNQVWYIEDPGNHDTAVHSGERAAPLMDWLLFGTCASHPRLDAAGKANGIARIDHEITTIATLPGAVASTRCATLFRLPALLADKQIVRKLLTAWADSSLASAKDATPVTAHQLLTLLCEDEHFASVDAKKRKSVIDQLKVLRKDEPGKSEWSAWQALRIAQAADKKAGNTKGGLLEAGQAYQSLISKWPTTWAAGEAKPALERIKMKLEKK
jgi:hypothetical protein